MPPMRSTTRGRWTDCAGPRLRAPSTSIRPSPAVQRRGQHGRGPCSRRERARTRSKSSRSQAPAVLRWTRPGQVDRARELIEHYQGKVKPILTGGSYLDLMKAWNKRCSHDQEGALVRRSGSRQVPAIVSAGGTTPSHR